MSRARPGRLGVFGGTFDPIHFAHLAIAERAREELALDRVLFVPTGRPPHKRGRSVTPFVHRLAMARQAARGDAAFEVLDLEGRRTGPSYTVDTLTELGVLHPGAELVLIVGEDTLADLHHWYQPEAVLRLATLAVAPRTPLRGRAASTRLPRPLARGARVVWLSGPIVDLSSTELRDRARRGRSLRFLVPDVVIDYARRRRLYRSRS